MAASSSSSHCQPGKPNFYFRKQSKCKLSRLWRAAETLLMESLVDSCRKFLPARSTVHSCSTLKRQLTRARLLSCSSSSFVSFSLRDIVYSSSLLANRVFSLFTSYHTSSFVSLFLRHSLCLCNFPAYDAFSLYLLHLFLLLDSSTLLAGVSTSPRTPIRYHTGEASASECDWKPSSLCSIFCTVLRQGRQPGSTTPLVPLDWHDLNIPPWCNLDYPSLIMNIWALLRAHFSAWSISVLPIKNLLNQSTYCKMIKPKKWGDVSQIWRNWFHSQSRECWNISLLKWIILNVQQCFEFGVCCSSKCF